MLRWRPVQQHHPGHALPDPVHTLREQLAAAELRTRIAPGVRVAVLVGSRGIAGVAALVAALCAELRALRAEPFVVPAMGSHGGATAAGQVAVLAELGVTESSVGAPVRAGMETVELGRVAGGATVFCDRIAAREADVVIPVVRIKPHTSFSGSVESGLHKMLAVGLGNRDGAEEMHRAGMEHFAELVCAAGQLVLHQLVVPFGVAVVEDAHGDAGVVEVVAGEQFAAREPELLQLARSWQPQLPFARAHVLLVQEIGKEISGIGMDPAVTGRFNQPGRTAAIAIDRVVVLGLSGSGGNACGIGLADITTRAAAARIDWPQTYTNHITSGLLAGARLPLVAESDRRAVEIAIGTLRPAVPPAEVRLAWIRNTLALDHLWVSEPLWAEIEGRSTVEMLAPPDEMSFDGAGALTLARRS